MPEPEAPPGGTEPRASLARASGRVSPLLLTALLLSSAEVPIAEPPATVGAPRPVPSTAASEGVHALHVSRRGSASGTGTRTDPLRTIGAALRRARDGDLILVHGGVYREQLEIPRGKRLRIRAVGAGRVWLDGSRIVRRWRSTPHGFVHHRWRPEFDASPTYTWGAPDHTESGWSFLNPRHPMAAHPDQVWVDGRAQRQVGALGQLRPGTFFVDDAGDALHLGSSPRGRSVRATVLDKAISIRSEGTRIAGIGVRRFGPSVPHMGAVTVEANGVQLSNLVVRDNATTGLHVTAAGATLRGVTTARNGMLGMSATYADGLHVIRLRSRRNNTEGFNTSPVAGGAKIGRSRRVTVRKSVFAANAGTGLWFDESTSDVRVLDSTMRANARHGISLEISARALVADTLVSENAGDGIKVNNTQDVELWNNTIVDNGRPLDLLQDDRRPNSPDAPGRDPRRPFPDPDMTWRLGPVIVRNNILGRGRTSANCLLCVEDYSGRFSADEMGVRPDGNVYQRSSASRPAWVVVWSRGPGDPAVFSSVAAFRHATGHERAHLDLIGRRAITTTMAAVPWVSNAARRVAVPLSRTVADLLGRDSGVRHLGAWVTRPPRR